jgi:hypothetical protein
MKSTEEKLEFLRKFQEKKREEGRAYYQRHREEILSKRKTPEALAKHNEYKKNKYRNDAVFREKLKDKALQRYKTKNKPTPHVSILLRDGEYHLCYRTGREKGESLIVTNTYDLIKALGRIL